MSWTIANIGRQRDLCHTGCQTKIAYSYKQGALNVAALQTIRYSNEHFVYICGDHYHITTYFDPNKGNYVEERIR